MINSFKFSSVSDQFDQHIAHSIPGYTELIATIEMIAPAFLQESTRLYDFGCSTGNVIKRLERQNPTIEMIGYDIEKAFSRHWQNGSGEVADIRTAPIPFAGLVLSLFTLQFLPTIDRQPLLNRIYENLVPSGALIIAEKTHFDTGKVQELASNTYHQSKRQHFTDTEILDKTTALVPIMRPLTTQQNIDQLRAAGFQTIEPIWQRLHFTAWLAIK